MSRKVSGEQKTAQLRIKQKNGDIYVYDRKYHYDPQKKYEVDDGKKLIGKIKKGTTEIVPTRPRKKKEEAGKKSTDNFPILQVKACSKRTGMTDIIRYVAEKSGVTEELKAAIKDDPGLAMKAETLAWYDFAEDGDTWPQIRNWSLQYLSQLPYKETPISQDMYHDVFVAIGADASIEQTIFRHRADTLGNDELIALDSTTISTESANLVNGRLAVHKDKLIKNVYKLVTFYCIRSRQPVAFALIPGNVPDVQTVDNSIKQLKALDLKNVEVVSDGGYCSDGTLCAQLKAGYHFITHVSSDTKWVSPIIEECREELLYGGEIVHCAPEYSAYAKVITHEFRYERKKGRTSTGTQKGDIESYSRRVHVFVYYSSLQKGIDDAKFREQFDQIRNELMRGAALSAEEEKFAEKYAIIKERAGKVTDVSMNTTAYKKKMRYNGFLVLVADKERDANKALEKYREREYVEEDIKNNKAHSGGKHPRVWNDDTLKGELLVQFMALSMHESWESMVRFQKDTLGIPNGDLEHDSSENIKAEIGLRSWLHKRSTNEVLHWFDAVYQYSVQNENGNHSWKTELSARDRMFLTRIGMDLK